MHYFLLQQIENMDLMKTCQTLIVVFYYYAVEVSLIHSHTMQLYFSLSLYKNITHSFRSYNKIQFFRELTDGSANPTNMDGSYCACHSKSFKVDEYIAAVPANSRRSVAVVAVQPPQLAAEPGDVNVASNWSRCYLRKTGCINQKRKYDWGLVQPALAPAAKTS